MAIFDRRRAFAAIALAAPVAVLSACTPNQPPSNAPGTVPPVWTGAPAPAEVPEAAQSGQSGSATDSLTTVLETPDGKQIARATFDFRPQYVTVTVQTTGVGHLSPGFHGVHIHAFGKCEANSAPPGGGTTGDFLSAGGHFQAPGHNEHPQSGDLTSLHVRDDGGGLLVTTTDAFTKEELLAGDGTAIIIHDGDDNFGNIPADRYTQANGTPGPDQTTLTTGDAGKRAACGVIGRA